MSKVFAHICGIKGVKTCKTKIKGKVCRVDKTIADKQAVKIKFCFHLTLLMGS
jgi:hypothetical protein